MKISGSLLLLILLTSFCHAQDKIDSALYKKLKAMRTEDQKWRIESYKLFKGEHSDYDQKAVDRNMQKTDSLNEAEAKKIFLKYGYPGYSLVGEAGSNWFWTIVQHCDDDEERNLWNVDLLVNDEAEKARQRQRPQQDAEEC